MKALSMVLLLAAATVSAQSTPATPTPATPTPLPEDVAIFAVRHGDGGQALSIDPVVIVHYGSEYGSDPRVKVIPR